MLNGDFSRTGLARVMLITILGTLGCMFFALLTVAYTSEFMEETPRKLSYAAAILVPLVLSAPIFFVFASKLRELAIAHRGLAAIAAQDSLTTCLNRGAFITLVDAYLSQVNSLQPIRGGLLVVDADHFKLVNDRYGHLGGDEALRLISAAIKSVLRPTDLLGRVGGEEFAILLPQTDYPGTQMIAERIRSVVSDIQFNAAGNIVPLSVSIGGVGFIEPLLFNQLFQLADERLYEAKRRGRNRVEFRSSGPTNSVAASK
jgi:diguanylate cyclase